MFQCDSGNQSPEMDNWMWGDCRYKCGNAAEFDGEASLATSSADNNLGFIIHKTEFTDWKTAEERDTKQL